MIRPFTLVTMLMAGGAGLYLYQTKHTAQMLDKEIARTVKQTETTKERIGMLRGEWALLNEPERLSQLSQLHLGGLRTLAPTQFVALDQLAARLPAPVAPGTVALPPGFGTDEGAAAAAPAAPPVPAAVAPAPIVALPRTPVRPAVPAAEPQVADAKPAAPVRPAPRPAAPAPPQVAAAAPAPTRAIMAPVLPVASAPIHTAASDATAPGTIGAAVLRAMQARGQAPFAAPAASAPSVVAGPAYTSVMASAAPQSAMPAAVSMLGGGRAALPPPVPYSTR